MPEDSANKCRETWEVYMSNQKEPYILNEKEYAVLQDAISRGIKGMVQFDKFMLNTSFIVSAYRKRKERSYIALPEPEYVPMDTEKVRKKIREAKQSLFRT
jgi:hypothetical protein